MEVVIVNEYWPPYVTGGTEIFLESLASFLVSRGNNVKVISCRYPDLKNYEVRNGVEVYRIKSTPFRVGHRYQIPGLTFYWNNFNMRVKKVVMKIVKTSDVIHINNIRHLSLSPMKAGNQLNIKTILDVHDYWPICFKRDLLRSGKICKRKDPLNCSFCILSERKLEFFIPFFFPLLYLDYHLREKNLYFDLLICHSRWMLSLFRSNGIVVPYPIRWERIGTPKNIGKKLKFLFVGRLQHQKGAHLLPLIAKELKKRKVDFKINIVGSGELENELRKKLKKFPVKFYGWVSNASKMREIYMNSDVLLVPSIWAEPFGINVIEAMSVGVPSIVSNYGGLKEIVEKNKTGIAVDPDPIKIVDAIENLVRNYTTFSKNCVKNSKKYKREVIFKAYEKIFKSLSQSLP